MKGRICLVTGATSGIGRSTAEGLARLGARVIVHGRDRAKAEAVVQEIIDDSKNLAVELVVADLASLEAVREMAKDLHKRHDRLDVLVNNAGIYEGERRESVDGYELTFAVNHLAPFLLTALVLDLLKAAPKARIVNVSSRAHRFGNIRWDDLRSRSGYSAYRAYGTSKLMNILFTRELARRLAGTSVTANSLHPGVIRTNLGGGRLFGLMGFLKLSTKSPTRGARTSVYLATSPEVEGISGKYFANEQEATPTAAAQDDEAARRLWKVSEELTGLAYVEARHG
jgi:NAD(P)-dependent dehydrogenase (short-subunit alcohol dehydrogenase family)